MEEIQLHYFILASLVVIITPGQDLLLVMSRAISHGSKAGLITATGVSIGLIGHSLITACGIGAILLASKPLFIVIKIIGALYLFYLGLRLLLDQTSGLKLKSVNKVSRRQLFFTGAFSNISNPNITIFYFAFLPQFIPASSLSPTNDLLQLGATFALLTFLVKGPMGYFAGILSDWIKAHPKTFTAINKVSGTILIGLGIRLALERRG